jgi:hypothetical protein
MDVLVATFDGVRGLLMVVGVVVLALGAFVALAVNGVRASRRLPPVGEGDPDAVCIGGMAWHGTHPVPLLVSKALVPYATPLGVVRLELHSWGIRIGPRWPHIAWGIPTWELRYGEIYSVQVVRHPGTTRTGIRMRTTVLKTPVVFWCTEVDEALAIMKDHLVLVIDGVIRLPFPTPVHPLPID